LAKTERPPEVIVEATCAHWRITGSEQFVPCLEDALDSQASTQAKQWLEEIRLLKSTRIVVTEHKSENGVEALKGIFVRDECFSFPCIFGG
jgi:hypothetical protein